MKICKFGKDGGPESRVWGFWLIELKDWFSIAFLRFEDGSREAYHSHAFNALSWLLSGGLQEDILVDWNGTPALGGIRLHKPSVKPIWTARDTFHKVSSRGRSWVLTFRGPWSEIWKEYRPEENRFVTLTHGRAEIPPIP